ncbi:MAG: hypothetical protein E7292_04640 [Lachnospiraceae bacterium]|nr:hypothetical protein [Lachnospiraceae bacterium]
MGYIVIWSEKRQRQYNSDYYDGCTYGILMRVNVPAVEEENLVGKVKEKKMAELFANMEHMDIQEEQRKTAEQRQRAERAEERAEREKERAEREKERAEQAEERIKRAEEIIKRAEAKELQCIQNLMRNTSCSAEKAMDMLEISVEKRER